MGLVKDMKIANDKYYTPIDLANHCWEVVGRVIGFDKITHIIEPSCGNGAFYNYPIKPDIGYDIAPEMQGDSVIYQDYLTIGIPYVKGRLVIGNPPYGNRMNMAQKFFKKSIQIADYIAFILPISQLNNSQSMYEFDLIHSEDLGVKDYSGKKLHCCFNVYRRPESGQMRGKPNKSLSYLTIIRQDTKGYEFAPFDIRLCYWGDGTAGKILNDGESYSGEYKIKVADNYPRRQEVIDYLKTFDWRSHLKCIAMRKIQIFHIIDVVRREFGDYETEPNLFSAQYFAKSE